MEGAGWPVQSGACPGHPEIGDLAQVQEPIAPGRPFDAVSRCQVAGYDFGYPTHGSTGVPMAIPEPAKVGLLYRTDEAAWLDAARTGERGAPAPPRAAG